MEWIVIGMRKAIYNNEITIFTHILNLRHVKGYKEMSASRFF